MKSRNQREGRYAGRYSALELTKFIGHDTALWEVIEKRHRRETDFDLFWPSLKSKAKGRE